MHETRIFIGQIRPLPASGRPSAIFKTACTSPIHITATGISGDQQADLRVHGGPEKAIHAYPTRHYARLAAAFPEHADAMVAGSLGENLALPEFTEADVHIGEIFSFGTAYLQLCQPRSPCWKIDERFAGEGIAAYIAEHGLTGWYFRVLTAGEAAPGASLRRHQCPPAALSLHAAQQLLQAHRPDPAALEQLAATPGIALHWQQKIRQRAAWLRAHPEAIPAPLPKFHVKPQE